MKNKIMYPMQHSALKEVRFEEKHKQNVLKAVRENSKIIEMKIKKENRRPSGKKRVLYTTIAAVAIFTLFIGSTNISLGIAKVAAKIPYFSLFIKQEEYKFAIYDVISEAMRNSQYDINSVQVSVPKKEIMIEAYGSKKEVKKINEEVSDKINTALIAYNFGKFDIKVKAIKDEREKYQEDSPEVKKYIKDSGELEKKIINLLNQNKYEMAFPPQVRINKIEKFIYVAIPKTESKERVNELKKMLLDVSKPYGEPFKFRVTKIDMEAREQEIRWGKLGIINIIGGGLMENEAFKVTGYSYSFHPLPLQIKIKTSVKSSDPKAKELVKTIENEINYFIQSDERTKEIRNDPYELTILSKDKKKIN